MEKDIGKNLALDFVRVTESAAIAAAKWIGRGDGKAADKAAVDEMRDRFNQINFSATVVIGEGEKDQAPKLYTGEKIGSGDGPEMDLAVDPLEATDSVAFGRSNAQSMIVLGPKGSLLHAPDTYMNKIAAGGEAAKVIDLDASVETNIKAVAKALNKGVSDVTVIVMDRPRHETLIQEIRQVGAKIHLITDGDVAAAIAACLPDSGIDLLMGIGGSTEAVLAAAAVKVLDGGIFCRFVPRNEADKIEIEKCLDQAGIKDISKIFSADDLAKGNELSFTATGILDGPMIAGVDFKDNTVITHSIAMRSATKTIRYITTYHKK